MNYQLLILFVVLSFVNVILQTIKSLLTINGSKFVSAVANALAYGLYTIVVIYTVCDLPLTLKVVVTMITNFFGVYVSKWLVDKFSKDKLWKVEMAIPSEQHIMVKQKLERDKMQFNFVEVGHWVMFNVYCSSCGETDKCKDVARVYNGKISAYESKSL